MAVCEQARADFEAANQAAVQAFTDENDAGAAAQTARDALLAAQEALASANEALSAANERLATTQETKQQAEAYHQQASSSADAAATAADDAYTALLRCMRGAESGEEPEATLKLAAVRKTQYIAVN